MKIVKKAKEDGRVYFNDLKLGDVFQKHKSENCPCFMKTGKTSVVSLNSGLHFAESCQVGRTVYIVEAELHIL